MENKNSVNILLVVLIVLLATALGILGGYIIFNNIGNQNEEPEVNNGGQNGNNEPENFTLDDARNLMNKYKSSHYLEDGDYYFYDIDNDFAKNIFSFSKLNGSKELSCGDIFGNGYENSDDFGIAACGSQFEDPVVYSYDEVLEKKKNLFGSSSTLKKESIDDKCLYYTYVESINSFVFIGSFCGGDTSSYSKLIVDDFKIDNSTLKIYSTKYVYEETKLEKTIKSIHYFKKEKDNWYLYNYENIS